MRLLCLFMVADREDCPGGWRANEPTTWFISEAQRRGLIDQLVLDTHDHPSVISAGGVVIHDGHVLAEILGGAWDLPKGKIEFDETPESAATRVLQIATGTRFPQSLSGHLFDLDDWVENASPPLLSRIRYYLMYIEETFPTLNSEIQWLPLTDINTLPWVNDALPKRILDAIKNEISA